jgi:hypothetical protein
LAEGTGNSVIVPVGRAQQAVRLVLEVVEAALELADPALDVEDTALEVVEAALELADTALEPVKPPDVEPPFVVVVPAPPSVPPSDAEPPLPPRLPDEQPTSAAKNPTQSREGSCMVKVSQ